MVKLVHKEILPNGSNHWTLMADIHTWINNKKGTDHMWAFRSRLAEAANVSQETFVPERIVEIIIRGAKHSYKFSYRGMKSTRKGISQFGGKKYDAHFYIPVFDEDIMDETTWYRLPDVYIVEA